MDVFSTVKRASEFGVVIKDEVRLDWPHVIDRKQYATKNAEGDKVADLKRRGIDYYKEKVTFLSPEEVTLGTERIRPKESSLQPVQNQACRLSPALSTP